MNMDVRPSSHRIGALTVTCYEKTRVLIINGIAVKLSPTEYRIIQPLLAAGDLVEEDDLMLAAYQEKGSMDAFYKHIGKIRAKLRATDLYLHRAISFGYVLTDSAPEAEKATTG